MAFSHGKDTVFKVDNAAGALTDISAFLRSVSFPETLETAEVTVFGKASKEYIVGLKDSTLSIEGKWDPTPDAHLSGILGASATKTFEYGPEGSAVGKVKYTGEAILTAYNKDSPLDDAAGFTAEFQVTGNVSRTTF